MSRRTESQKNATGSGTKPPIALITGGATRLGAAISEKLAKGGYRVIIHAHRHTGEASQLATALHGSHIQADLCTPDGTTQLIDTLTKHTQSLHLLVNNAAVMHSDQAAPFALRQMKRLNVDAPTGLISALQPQLAATGGAIINIGDIAAHHPFSGFTLYSETKATLLRLQHQMALKLARAGIRINTICPGLVLAADHQSPAEISRLRTHIPLPRQGQPGDVAELTLFLANAPYITGQVINVDGGRTLAYGDQSSESR